MASPITFLKQVRDELSRVIWPSRQSIIRLTGQVIFVSLIVGAFVGILDLGLTALNEFLIL